MPQRIGMNLTAAHIDEASELLMQCWIHGRKIPALPENLRPTTRAEGYAIAAGIEKHTAHPLYGWKIAATSEAGQRHIGVDGPLAGRLVAERVIPCGQPIALGANLLRVAEPEYAFRIAHDLPAAGSPYDVHQVMAAVDALHIAIEVPDTRYSVVTEAGVAQLIADNGCNHEFILGPAVPGSWRAHDLAAHRVVASVVGKLEREGGGRNVLGDPRVALTWLVNELGSSGIDVGGGQVVTTGTSVVPLPVEPGDTVYADFGWFGNLTVTFTD